MKFLEMKMKKVIFSKKVDVVLIPCRKEYESWKHTLWYCDIDFARFTREEIERCNYSLI
jgi:hypothetical protein